MDICNITTSPCYFCLAATEEPDLIGDFTKPFALPLTPGKHQDLKCITPQTLVDLIGGKYSDHVENYTIVDCRYYCELRNVTCQQMMTISFPPCFPGILTSTRTAILTMPSTCGPKIWCGASLWRGKDSKPRRPPTIRRRRGTSSFSTVNSLPREDQLCKSFKLKSLDFSDST